MSFAYHGNYCGPGWSDGKFQKSVVGKSKPLDAFDESCQRHDSAYANNEDLREADLNFFSENFGRNIKSTIAAIPVGLQGMARRTTKRKSRMSKRTKTSGRRPRVVAPASSSVRTVRPRSRFRVRTRRSKRQIRRRVLAAPISTGEKVFGRGNTIRTVGSGPNYLIQEGRFYISNISTPALGYTEGDTIYSTPINPTLFNNSEIKLESARWERYIFESFTLIYKHAAPTTTSGEVLIYADYDVADQINVGNIGIQAAMASNNVARGSVWTDLGVSLTRKPLEKYYFVDAGTSDLRLSQQGTVVFKALTNLPGATTLGHLEVTYRIRWMCKHLDPTTGLSYAALVKSTVGQTQSNIFGTAPNVNPNSDFTLVPNPSGNLNQIQLLLQPRTVFIELIVSGTTMVAPTISVTGGTYTLEGSCLNSGNNQIISCGTLAITTANPVISFVVPAASISSTEFRCFGINAGLLKKEKSDEKSQMEKLMKRLANLELFVANQANDDFTLEEEEKPAKPKSGTTTPTSNRSKILSLLNTNNN